MRTVSEISSLSSRTIRMTGQLSLLALLAGLGACSNFNSMRSPVFTGSTNQADIIAVQPSGNGPPAATASVYAAPGVQGADLPPPQGYEAAAPQAPQPYTPPAPYAATGLPTPLGQIAGGQAAAVPAQPAPRLGAPPVSLGEQAARIDGGESGGGAVHMVQSGDTAWNISRRYGVSVDRVIAANGGSQTVKIGQRIVISGASAPQQPVQLASLNPQASPAPMPAAPMPAIPAAAATQPPAPAIAATPAPSAAEQQVAVAPQTGAAGALAPAAPEPQVTASSGFRWPVRGRVISGFGKRPNGERNDGINLAVPEGTAVKAAEDGTVIYAGNELKSYGNLVLVRHSNGWVSAYAHNSELKVRRGEEVKRGQLVALSGMSGGVTTPQVHFELRKDATPVDPLQHLTES